MGDFAEKTMSLIEVAIPMMRGRRRFHVEKGRRWSIIEHLMLEAVSRAPATTAELSKTIEPAPADCGGGIHTPYARWLGRDYQQSDCHNLSRDGRGEGANQGRGAKGLTTIRPRTMSFAYDRVTGQAFRGSEFSIRACYRMSKSADADALVFLSPAPRRDAEDLSQIYSALEGESEVIVGSDSSPHLPVEGFAVVRVMGGVIDDMSARAELSFRLTLQ
jgi:cardiolipin synthase